MSLKDLIERDINTIFLNTDEFCDNLTIQVGRTRLNVIGSLQQNLVKNNSGNSSPLQKVSYVLYIKYPLEIVEATDTNSKLFSAGAHITINDQPFTIVDVSNEMGLATINLSTTSGR